MAAVAAATPASELGGGPGSATYEPVVPAVADYSILVVVGALRPAGLLERLLLQIDAGECGSTNGREKRRFACFLFLSGLEDGCGSGSSSRSASFTTFPNFEPIRLTKLASSPFSLPLS